MPRFFAIIFGVMAALFTLAPGSRAQTAEESVKATFVYRFASFIAWPLESFADSETPIRLCVIGADPFAQVLTRTVAAQRVDGRTFEVRSPSNVTAASGCHIIYVVGSRTEDTLRAVRGAPVLTITDGSAGSGARGIIHFVVVEDRVRFHIDDARAAESHIPIDARLLSLAISVRRRAVS